MVYALTWLPEVLEAAGLKVAETPGWRTRGRAEMGVVRGVMCHHTATAAPGNMPSLNLLINGRSDLAGPLAQLGLGRDGTFYVIAAGRANHAGAGRWEGVTTGNSSFIGIEAENSGKPGEPWPEVQVDAYERGVAAILRKIGAGANMCCGHKEYALPKGRKPDPSFDMAPFRAAVADLVAGKTPKPPIPAADEGARPTVRRGDKSDWVKKIQTAVGALPVDGDFGPGTEARVRALQRDHGLVPDGIVGPQSWIAMDGPPPAAPAAPAPPAPPTPSVAPLAAPLPVAALPPADDATHKCSVVSKAALGPDGQKFASVSGPGFFTIGKTTMDAYLAGAKPPGVSDSTVRVIRAMCVNEGRLEAINSYDNSFLSIGIFQWTAGAGANPGELARLLADLKAADVAAFQALFGRYGLDARIAGPTSVTGAILLDGTELKTAAQKAVLRRVEWAYRFWRAGHHPAMRAAQFALAVSRIGRFRTLATAGKPLNAWMTSELGIALMLDEHVNRPGHVPGTLKTAIATVGGGDPAAWTTANERKLIDAYIAAREGTMTDSSLRAKNIRAFVTRGELSDARGSFS